MPKFGASVDLQHLELKNIRVENLASAPGSPASGWLYYDSTNNVMSWYDGTSFVTPALTTGDQSIAGTKTFDDSGAAKTKLVVAAAASQSVDVVVTKDGSGTTGFAVDKDAQVVVTATTSAKKPLVLKAAAAQAAHLAEFIDSSATLMSWVDTDGSLRGPNIGNDVSYSIAGAQQVGTGVFRWYNNTGVTLTIRGVRISVGTAPTGSSLIADINKNGTTIFTTQANRPAIAAAANTSGFVTNMDVTTLADGDYLTIDIDQVGSTVAGSDLTAQILVY